MDYLAGSGHTDDATAARVAEIAKIEDRSPDQIAAAALRFYVRLPPWARSALCGLEGQSDAEIDEAAWAVGRALVDQQYDAAMKARRLRGGWPLPPDASEQDILDYAVKICRRR
jgi:predicted transcriptional regulator